MGLLAPAGVCQELQCTGAEPNSRSGEDQPADTNLGFLRSRTGCGCLAHRCPARRLLSTCMKWSSKALTHNHNQLQSAGHQRAPGDSCKRSLLEPGLERLCPAPRPTQQKPSLPKSKLLHNVRFIACFFNAFMYFFWGGKPPLSCLGIKIKALEISAGRFSVVVLDV